MTIRKLWIFLPLVIVLFLTFTILSYSNSDTGDEHGRPLETILEEIRETQGLGPNERIDPERVSSKQLEELGESVMSIIHPDPEQHELMDNMMGGEGSESLSAMHQMMGYQYLGGNSGGMMGGMMGPGMMGGMMGPGMMGRGMMGGPFSYGIGRGRYGMMPFGYGGIIMWSILIILIVIVIYFIVRNQRYQRARGYSERETPLEIAKGRYARGEVPKEEYEQIKRALQ